MHMYKHINDTNTQTHIETLTYIHSHAQAYTLATQINTHWNIDAHKRGKQIKPQWNKQTTADAWTYCKMKTRNTTVLLQARIQFLLLGVSFFPYTK